MEKTGAAILSGLQNSLLQGVWADGEGRATLKLRLPGATHLLLLSTKGAAKGGGIVGKRPPAPPRIPALAAYLRAHGEGGRLSRVFSAPKTLALEFTSQKGRVTLVLDANHSPPRFLVLDSDDIIRVADAWDPKGGQVRPKGKWLPPPESSRDGFSSSAEAVTYLEERGAKLFNSEEGAKERADPASQPKEVKRWKNKLLRRIDNIKADISKTPDPHLLKKEADLLGANLWRVKKGDDKIAVEDPDNPGTEITIPLQETKSPGDNLTQRYRTVKKAGRTLEIARKRLKDAEKELLAPPPEPKAGPTRPGIKAEGSKPFRRFISSDGWRILVGKNRIENDHLLKEAKDWDIWLHARGGSGAHVILVKPGKESTAPERTLYEAAGLAALHSGLSKEKQVEVIYVEAKRVNKPKGAGPGKVVVSGESTLRVPPGAGNPKPA